METNDIRNYNEMTPNGIKTSIRYIEKIRSITSEEDKDACLRFLTLNHNSEALCQGYYDDKHIQSIVETSNYLLYVHMKEDPTRIVAFALVQSKRKKKGKILDILLACAISNKHKFGKMIAHSIYTFAVTHAYPFLYVSPRTADLRKTFMKYGFESIHGREGIDEVLEKEIEPAFPIIPTCGKTRKQKQTSPLEDGNRSG